MNNVITTLHRRVQNRDYSDFRTLRVDAVGQCRVIGRVYVYRHGVSSPQYVVEHDGQTDLAWSDADGRLFTADAPSALVDAASEVLRTGRAVRRPSARVEPICEVSR